jgi:hypothetical protein
MAGLTHSCNNFLLVKLVKFVAANPNRLEPSKIKEKCLALIH